MIVLLNASGKGRAEYKGCALDQRLLAMYRIMIQTVGAFSIRINVCFCQLEIVRWETIMPSFPSLTLLATLGMMF